MRPAAASSGIAKVRKHLLYGDRVATFPFVSFPCTVHRNVAVVLRAVSVRRNHLLSSSIMAMVSVFLSGRYLIAPGWCVVVY